EVAELVDAAQQVAFLLGVPGDGDGIAVRHDPGEQVLVGEEARVDALGPAVARDGLLARTVEGGAKKIDVLAEEAQRGMLLDLRAHALDADFRFGGGARRRSERN